MSQWFLTSNRLPPDRKIVLTKDSGGNIQKLKRIGNLWWFPDGSMYVYYVPKSWRFTGGAA